METGIDLHRIDDSGSVEWRGWARPVRQLPFAEAVGRYARDMDRTAHTAYYDHSAGEYGEGTLPWTLREGPAETDTVRPDAVKDHVEDGLSEYPAAHLRVDIPEGPETDFDYDDGVLTLRMEQPTGHSRPSFPEVVSEYFPRIAEESDVIERPDRFRETVPEAEGARRSTAADGADVDDAGAAGEPGPRTVTAPSERELDVSVEHRFPPERELIPAYLGRVRIEPLRLEEAVGAACSYTIEHPRYSRMDLTVYDTPIEEQEMDIYANFWHSIRSPIDSSRMRPVNVETLNEAEIPSRRSVDDYVDAVLAEIPDRYRAVRMDVRERGMNRTAFDFEGGNLEIAVERGGTGPDEPGEFVPVQEIVAEHLPAVPEEALMRPGGGGDGR